MKFLKKYQLIIIGLITGAILGFSYYYFVGCVDGCTITSNPYNSTLYGALWGGLFLNLFNKNSK